MVFFTSYTPKFHLIYIKRGVKDVEMIGYKEAFGAVYWTKKKLFKKNISYRVKFFVFLFCFVCLFVCLFLLVGEVFFSSKNTIFPLDFGVGLIFFFHALPWISNGVPVILLSYSLDSIFTYSKYSSTVDKSLLFSLSPYVISYI